MNTIQIRLYDLFRHELSLSDEKAAAFVSAVEEVVINKIKKNSNIHSLKVDIYRLKLKIEQTKSDLHHPNTYAFKIKLRLLPLRILIQSF